MSERSPSFNSIVRANSRGWLIVAFIFASLSVVFSARSTLGLIMPTWEQGLGWGRTFVSMGGSVILVVMTLISPLAVNLLDRVGPRPVIPDPDADRRPFRGGRRWRHDGRLYR